MTQLEIAERPRWPGLALTSPSVLVPLVALVVLALLPAVVNRADVLILLFLVFLGVTLSQSWNVLGGFAGQVNLGHAAFFGIGAVVARSTWIGGWPYALSFASGGIVALAFAMVIGVPTFRLRGTYFAIGTLGLAEVLRITTANALPAVSSMPPPFVAAYDLTLRYELALWLAAACVGVSAWLLRSRVGLGMLAIREDEQAAQATGVGALRHKIVALGLSSLFAGLAGSVFAFYHVSYYPELPFEPTWTFDSVLPVYVGGIGTLWGPVIGAALYVIIRQQLEISLPQAHQIIFGLLFILVVLMFPGGLVQAVRSAAHSPRLAGLRLGKRSG